LSSIVVALLAPKLRFEHPRKITKLKISIFRD